MTLGEWVRSIEISKKDAYALLSYVTGLDKIGILTNEHREITNEQLIKLTDMIDRHKKNEPIEHIINTGFFMGMEFYVNSDVLIPREDTECLVEEVLEYIKKENTKSVLDMCTGSGCIAISIASLAKDQEVTAVDISENAIYIAKKNATMHSVDINFVQSDLFEQIDKRVDIIVSNPPYIATDVIETLEPSVKNYDPILALDGGASGLDFYERLAKEAKFYLNDKGAIFLEIGYDQGEAVSNLFIASGYKGVEVKKDHVGLDRIVKAHIGEVR